MKRFENWNLKEELANSITHGIGFLLSIAGLVFLILTAISNENDVLALVSVIVYGTSMILLYLASTLYHSIPFERARKVFKKIDHSAIYVFIAGSYTPFLLIKLGGVLGWTLFGVVWGIALIGVAFKIVSAGKFMVFSTLSYILMGWLIVFAWRPLAANLPSAALHLLLAGGISYTVGTIFYGWTKIPGIKRIKLPFTHAIWHLFVLSGSALMFVAIVKFVL